MTAALPRLMLMTVVALSGGCASAGMTIPAELTTAERMPVEGRSGWRASQRAAFGPWEATDVDRSWTRGSGWSIGLGAVGGGSNRAVQEYSFDFFEGGARIGVVRCLATGSRGTATTRIVDIDVSAREALECRQDGTGGRYEPLWDLVLEATRDRHLDGFLRIGEQRYTVMSTGRGGGFTPASPYGFEVRDGERVVAAVETVNEGAVWLAPELGAGARSSIAAAAAALLLYDRVEGEE